MSGPEGPMLAGVLDWQRATLLTKAAGLTGEQLATRAASPSDLSIIGILRHVTEVERWWFRVCAGGQRDLGLIYGRPGNLHAALHDVSGDEAEASYAAYLAEIALARAAVAGLPLGHEFKVESFYENSGARPRVPVYNVRWTYLHMITEYARHNGHADLIRQSLDGVTGD
jgi:hypothetical protein